MKKMIVTLVTPLLLAGCNIRDVGSEANETLPPSSAVKAATSTRPPVLTPIPTASQKAPAPIPGAPMELLSLMPGFTEAGVAFNKQANGESALAVSTANIYPGTKINFDGRELATTYGSSEFLSALVPNDLIARPRKVEIFLSKDGKRSNSLIFTIEGKKEAR